MKNTCSIRTTPVCVVLCILLCGVLTNSPTHAKENYEYLSPISLAADSAGGIHRGRDRTQNNRVRYRHKRGVGHLCVEADSWWTSDLAGRIVSVCLLRFVGWNRRGCRFKTPPGGECHQGGTYPMRPGCQPRRPDTVCVQPFQRQPFSDRSCEKQRNRPDTHAAGTDRRRYHAGREILCVANHLPTGKIYEYVRRNT